MIKDRHRVWYNPNQKDAWFIPISELLTVITVLAIMLPAAAAVREKERGTIIEQLLVSPLTPALILLPKVISMTLVILAGTPVAEDLLAADLSSVSPPQPVSGELSSEVLLRRPDVMVAEHRLKGAYANIGAARAALFPRILLTTTIGTASNQFSGLFDSGRGTWAFTPQFVMPIFDARPWAALRVSKTDREIIQTQYEKTIQTAFREVADALAVNGTIDDQLAAQQSLTAAQADSYRLATRRYDKGIDGYLSVLDAQRSHIAAQQGLTSLRLAKMASQVRLYAVLGGGG